MLALTAGAAAPSRRTMPLAELVSSAIPLVPGDTAKVEALFNAPAGATLTDRGWRHSPIEYRTSDGALLHVSLTSDWGNARDADVVRLEMSVDESQCIAATNIRDDLTAHGMTQWTTLGVNLGWTTTFRGKVIAISQRTGRCLAAVTIDTHRQAQPVSGVRALRIGPSGRPEPITPPAH